MKRFLVLATALVLVAPLVQAEDPPATETTPRAPRTPIYVVEYATGPGYLPGRPFSEQPGITEHSAYMDKLTTSGSLILGGPLFEDLDAFILSGGLLFFKVDSEDEARRLAVNDPAVEHGLMSIVDVSPFIAMIDPF